MRRAPPGERQNWLHREFPWRINLGFTRKQSPAVCRHRAHPRRILQILLRRRKQSRGSSRGILQAQSNAIRVCLTSDATSLRMLFSKLSCCNFVFYVHFCLLVVASPVLDSTALFLKLVRSWWSTVMLTTEPSLGELGIGVVVQQILFSFFVP